MRIIICNWLLWLKHKRKTSEDDCWLYYIKTTVLSGGLRISTLLYTYMYFNSCKYINGSCSEIILCKCLITIWYILSSCFVLFVIVPIFSHNTYNMHWIMTIIIPGCRGRPSAALACANTHRTVDSGPRMNHSLSYPAIRQHTMLIQVWTVNSFPFCGLAMVS